MEEQAHKIVTYSETLAILAVSEVEIINKARHIDPNNENLDLLNKTAAMIEAMETLVAALFEVTHEQMRENLGQVDPAVINRYLEKRAMGHVMHRISD